MPTFVNPNNYAVHLLDEDGRLISISGRQRVVLSEYFERYEQRGFIKKINETGTTVIKLPNVTKPVQAHISRSITKRATTIPKAIANPVEKHKRVVVQKHVVRAQPITATKQKRIVGRTLQIDPNELMRSNLEQNVYPISNNIGIGILSYNRMASLRRLIESITKYTDMRRTTVFVSDDCSDDGTTITYLNELKKHCNFVVMLNKSRLGVAGNSNRLLRCLARFRYGMLLNDDVEILRYGWDQFYFDAMAKTNFHHFIYREDGVYNAERGERCDVGGVALDKVVEKPHGAVLAFTNEMFKKVGYFDEAYGLYGMEHVDWSQKVYEFGLQISGFFDVAGSEQFFKIHDEGSAILNRSDLFRTASKLYKTRTPEYREASRDTELDSISYVIPFRNLNRTESIQTVVNNVRAQRFPVVDIVIVEQDRQTNVDLQPYQPVNYLLAAEYNNPLFNKAKAFNLGISRVKTDKVIMHDADMLASGHYTTAIFNTLLQYDSCHLGGRVLYTDEEMMNFINSSMIIDEIIKYERVIGYYEGGSIACRLKTFWKVGGFNEDFYGYGCEDCDFYARLSGGSNWKEDRTFNFIHLWHDRTPGWNDHHTANKVLESKLRQKTINERILMQHAQLKKLGYSDKLAEALG